MMVHLNILAVPSTHGLLMPPSGAQSRLFHLAKRLKSIGDNVVVLEDESYANSQERELVTPYYFKDIRTANRSLFILREINIDFIKALVKAVKDENIDVMEFSYPAGIAAAKCITRLMGRKIPLIYGSHNVESESIDVLLAGSQYGKLEAWLWRVYVSFMEWLTCTLIADHITTVSERDRDVFVNKYHLSREKTTVIPSGSDTSDISKRHAPNSAVRCDFGIDSHQITIFFHGLYSHPPNKEAIDLIKSYIAPQFEDDHRVMFLISGTDVPKFLRSNVRSVGFIQDLPNALANVDIAIVPLLRGAGTKLKVLDYMAAGLPIVTTQQGAQGIDITNGEQAIIVDGVGDEFIDAVKSLVDNDEERKRLGLKARSLAETQYSWDKIGDSLHALYEQLLSNS